MRISVTTLLATTAIIIFATGCAGPQRKFSRGLSNLGEPLRMGELGRSVEQTAIWNSPNHQYAHGFVKGMGRTLGRTLVGAYEVATFPIPRYDKVWFTPEYPVYADSYTPNLMSSSLFSTDSNLGFGGGDIAPMVPGSRFKIFDY